MRHMVGAIPYLHEIYALWHLADIKGDITC